MPDEAAVGQVLETLECKLPEQFDALLHQKRLGEGTSELSNRITGGESKFLNTKETRVSIQEGRRTHPSVRHPNEE